MSGTHLTKWALILAYPRLRELPREEWKHALHAARRTDFDTVEWIGIVGGVGFVTLLLRIDNAVLAAQPLQVIYIMQFLLAVPLLLVFVGPFCLRRTRRGLDRELARRHARNDAE